MSRDKRIAMRTKFDEMDLEEALAALASVTAVKTESEDEHANGAI
jgi:hypothetical protein